MLASSLKQAVIKCAASALILITPAKAQDTATVATTAPAVGEYVCAQMELIARIRLNPDGTFEYGLTAGSLYERAQGRWKRVGQRIELISDPKPVPLNADNEKVATFLLTPNDLGVMDLTGAYLEKNGEDLALSRPDGTLTFKPIRS